MGHQAPREAADARALAPHNSGTDGEEVIAVRHVLRDEPVNLLVLEEEDRIRVANRRFQKAVGVRGSARHHDLQSRHMRVERLDRLRVVEPAVNAPAEWRADHHGHRPVAVRAIARARGLAHYLVESRVDEVRELDLGDGDQAVQRRADRDAHDARLGERRVQHASFAEPRVQAVGRAEHTALATHVLTKYEHPLVALHLLGDGGAHRVDHAHLSHCLVTKAYV